MLDPWSICLRGEDPEATARELAPLVAYTTLADYVRLPRYRYRPQLINYESGGADLVRAVPLGEGEMDNLAFLRGLAEGGYDGAGPLLRRWDVGAIVGGKDPYERARERHGRASQLLHVLDLHLDQRHLGRAGARQPVGIARYTGHLNALVGAQRRQGLQARIVPIQRREVRSLSHDLDGIIAKMAGVRHELFQGELGLAPKPRIADREQR